MKSFVNTKINTYTESERKRLVESLSKVCDSNTYTDIEGRFNSFKGMLQEMRLNHERFDSKTKEQKDAIFKANLKAVLKSEFDSKSAQAGAYPHEDYRS